MIRLDAFHTQEFRYPILKFPVLAEGFEQWLGVGYYFWQDFEYAKWWGENKKMNGIHKKYSIFKATLEFEEDDFIDTVFNEQDYYNFVSNIEKFAKVYYDHFREKPTLEEFNDFIQDNNLWENIKIIRFQDVPENNQLLKVKNYYYKKRIQLRVNDPKIITNFAIY